MYTPRTGHAVVVYNKMLYLMGGTDETARQNDIYQYEVETKTWRMLENVTGIPPSARSGSKAVVYADSIFFFGGYTKKEGEYMHIIHAIYNSVGRTELLVDRPRVGASC